MRGLAIFALACLSFATWTLATHAAPECTGDSKGNWMSKQAMQAKAAELGYERIKTFKVSGNCYEIYGYTKDGKKAEVYFNPVSGDVVKANIGG